MKICPVCSTEYADDVRFCPNDGQTLRASSPAHDLVGQVIADRYHVVKKLGEGGLSRSDSARAWARRGPQLDPGLKSCQQIVHNAGGP